MNTKQVESEAFVSLSSQYQHNKKDFDTLRLFCVKFTVSMLAVFQGSLSSDAKLYL